MVDHRYRSVKLPTSMILAIEAVVKNHPECGFTSIADFVKDAVRHYICFKVHNIDFQMVPAER